MRKYIYIKKEIIYKLRSKKQNSILSKAQKITDKKILYDIKIVFSKFFFVYKLLLNFTFLIKK